MPSHRVQIDIDIQAETHEEAVDKVLDYWISINHPISGIRDSLVLEENEKCCPTCNLDLFKPTLWTQNNE